MQWNHLNPEIDCIIRRQTYNRWEIPSRYINNYELVFLLKGEGEIRIQQKYYHVHKDDLFCFSPGILHSLNVRHEPYMEFYGVHFTLPEELRELQLPEFLHLESSFRISSLFKDMYEIYQKKPCFYQWKQNLILEQILCEILCEQTQKNEPIELKRIKKVLEYIHSNPTHSFTLQEMLQMTGLKKTQFMKSFHNITGSSPMKYISALRMEYAKDLLLNERMSISEISQKCGYSDEFYFSRCFKKHFSISPQRYRKESY